MDVAPEYLILTISLRGNVRPATALSEIALYSTVNLCGAKHEQWSL